MAKSQEKGSEVVTEADVDWAYGVLSAVKEAMDKVGGEESAQLIREIVDELPNILEAFIILVGDEHRQFVAGVVRSWVKLMKSIRK